MSKVVEKPWHVGARGCLLPALAGIAGRLLSRPAPDLKDGKASAFVANWLLVGTVHLVNLGAITLPTFQPGHVCAMNTSALQAALQQLTALAHESQGMTSSVAGAAGSGGFTGELQASLKRINQLQQTANQQSNAFQVGAPDVSLNDVMVDMQKAALSFQMGVQVRNRLVTAYKDVMAMQV
ncbi:flagellar hook-basal body complex protein FliE [Pseudomonas putida]